MRKSRIINHSQFSANSEHFIALSYIRLRVCAEMAANPTESRISANLPPLDDSNFEFWRQSVALIASGLGIHSYLDKEPADLKKLDDASRRSFFFLTNNMLTSMSSKARRIASGGGNIDELTPCAILRRLDAHYLRNRWPMTYN